MKIRRSGKGLRAVLMGSTILILIGCSMEAHHRKPAKPEIYLSTARTSSETDDELKKILSQLKKWPEDRPVVKVARKRDFGDYSLAYSQSVAVLQDHSTIPISSPSDPKPLKKFVLFKSKETTEKVAKVQETAEKKTLNRPRFRIRTTAYTHNESDHLVYGKKNAIGTQLKFGSICSAASDWSRFPLGTRFIVVGQPEIVYEIDDYGSALVGTNTIDFYKPSFASMNKWGARHVEIEILKWGSFDQSLKVLKPRTGWSHVRRMVNTIVANNRAMAELRLAPLILE